MEFTAIVIAGGTSSRMGTNKAELKFGEHSQIERMVHMLKSITPHLLIVANKATPYQELGFRIIADHFPGKGPLAGIHAGLVASTTSWNLIMACDMPFVHVAHLRTLLAYTERVTVSIQPSEAKSCEAVLPVSAQGMELPLLAMYRRELSVGLSDRLANNDLRVMNWIRGLNRAEIQIEELVHGTKISSELVAFNMNYPDDYKQALTIFSQR